MPDIDYIVSTRNLSKRFDTRVATEKGWEKRTVAAVSNVSLDIAPGETLGLVGESGCGKTTLGRLLALFYEPSDGTITLQGVDVGKLKPRDIKSMRQQVQMVFQDPMSSLNPRHTIESILTEPMKIFGRDRASVRREKAGELLESVGLSAKNLGKYPHEFSGGQRQRITIARALVLNPAFVVADEPVSALDVSVQSQILNLLQDIKQEFHLTYLFISHDLAVVHHLADRVAVMYLGRIVEIADRETLFRDARHPYTQSLLGSVPTIVPNKSKIGRVLQGDPPSPINPPTGCPFHPRCPHAADACRDTVPQLEAVDGNAGHQAACHRQDEIKRRSGASL